MLKHQVLCKIILIQLSPNEITVNYLKLIFQQYFPHFPTFTISHLKSNRIAILPPAMLRQQSRLRKLFLDENRLSRISISTFKGLRSLEWLTLGSNRLEAFVLSELHYMQRLKMLNLSNNYLHLRFAEFPPLPAVMEM